MSLYQLSKFLYTLNREPSLQATFAQDRAAALKGYSLTNEEAGAVVRADIGLIYVLGVNGQILMHFAALCGIDWPSYLQMMRDGIRDHGQVRAGVYRMLSSPDERVTI
ncbi:aromatic ring-opening dioxygenase subunit LigA [Sphingobium sp. CAP-1]|uniref:aromatic ring-opening dioxygenase subunit LigA n=1 Tax=Sphingobium sp. CAP-1 TaxID=2676077 RepID=UPI0012BB283F|nr:aromatic ring-opening dioxygenase subunit LigA [Sphingobium sp. CAP-1]QGP80449.1 aromatic ring-opening dioxygenase subunit LigA [Sphingobium sp. CAP-1]